MDELLKKTTIFFIRDSILTNENKEFIYSNKRHIIKKLYETSTVFRHTIENFNNVEKYYIIVDFLYRNGQNDPECFITFKLSIYLNNYLYIKEELGNFAIIENSGELGELREINFKINNMMYYCSQCSINIEWQDMSEEEKLDMFYTQIDDSRLNQHTNQFHVFSVVLKNLQNDPTNHNERKKIYFPLHGGNLQSGLFILRKNKKSFIKNDVDFYEKYKLLFSDL